MSKDWCQNILGGCTMDSGYSFFKSAIHVLHKSPKDGVKWGTKFFSMAFSKKFSTFFTPLDWRKIRFSNVPVKQIGKVCTYFYTVFREEYNGIKIIMLGFIHKIL